MAVVNKKQRLLEILHETSFRVEREPVFKLASGRLSRYYIDCKQALSYPEARQLIADLIYESTCNKSFEAIGGLEIGAYPIATSVSDSLFRETGKVIRAFVVRKEPKSHGIRDLIAGDVKAGDRALIVDDVVTAGDSTIRAIDGARAAGLLVDLVIVLVDRQEADGKAQIERTGVKFEALCTLSELLEISNVCDKGANTGPDKGWSIRRQSSSPLAAR